MLTCPTRAEPGSHLTGALCPRIAPSPMMTRCAIANFGNGFDEPLHAIERKLFAMKGFHHPKGSHQAFLRGLAHLYNLVPYQRRAQHVGQCGAEVEGGKVPTRDWFLNLQILTSGGFR